MEQENKNVEFNNRLMMFIGIFMLAIYFSLGIWFVLTHTNIFQIPVKQQKLLGAMLIIYGLYRSYMLYSRYFKRTRSQVEIIHTDEKDSK